MKYKVHVGYGFHVNCYHSFRGDSNDAYGFGSDIRIIRRIIEILDDLNQKGIPAKGTWDFENAYSLEDILPKYAPDIIENVKRRCIDNADENIIMGYNNGALSAMTPDEFDASIQLAITNDKNSGLVDIFGDCTKIVRPQEVMFSPSQVHDYKRNGIDAVCLYYSCVPFDAFRTIIPQLKDEYAFNPVTYTYQGESLTILPTYNNSDIMDSGTLRYLVKDLHKQQLNGDIQEDVFIFINMDADAIFWEPLGLPWPVNRLANTDGIRGLVEEIADLDYVVFDTPGNYLKTHKPLTEITFQHDTADGNFTGYASWSEKPFNRQIWTRLEKARLMAQVNNEDKTSPSFEDRIKLLSTTHFGLASPVLNIEREQRALALSNSALNKEIENRKKVKTLTLANINNAPFVATQITFAQGELNDIRHLNIKAENLLHFAAVAMDEYGDKSIETAYIVCIFEDIQTTYTMQLDFHADNPAKEISYRLQTDTLRFSICPHGQVLGLSYKEKLLAGKNFIHSFINYGNKKYAFQNQGVTALSAVGNIQGARIFGEIHLPNEISAGQYAFDFFTVPNIDCVFVQSRVHYPYTPENEALETHSSALGRLTDRKWIECVPLEITPSLAGELSIIKRNFTNDISAYPIASFWESVPENTSLDSFNNHLTNGFIGISNGHFGFGLANARQIQGSMAHCPMRLRQKNRQPVVSLAPFGTYFGNQRKHPTRSNGGAGEAFIVVTPQSNSIAPAYNGVEENAMQAFFGFEGNQPNKNILRTIDGFANGGIVLDSDDSQRLVIKDNVHFPEVKEHRVAANKLKPVIASGVSSTNLIKTAITAVKALSNIIIKQIKAK